jgi:hypothetical protein
MMNHQKREGDSQTPVQQKKSGIQQMLDESATSTYKDIVAIIEAKIELVKIEMTEKLAFIGASVLLGLILVIGTGYFITTLALLAGELLGYPFIGYFLVSFIFLLCFLFFTKFRPLLLKNLILKILLSVHDYTK